MKQLMAMWDMTMSKGAAGKIGRHVVWRSSPRRVYLQWEADSEQGGRQEEFHLIAQDGDPGFERGLLQRWEFGRDVIEPARYYVHREINRAMASHVSPAVLPFLKGQVSLFPHDSLAALHVHFALEISGQAAPPKICGYCGAFFVPRRSNQRYCEDRCRKNRWYNARD